MQLHSLVLVITSAESGVVMAGTSEPRPAKPCRTTLWCTIMIPALWCTSLLSTTCTAGDQPSPALVHDASNLCYQIRALVLLNNGVACRGPQASVKWRREAAKQTRTAPQGSLSGAERHRADRQQQFNTKQTDRQQASMHGTRRTGSPAAPVSNQMLRLSLLCVLGVSDPVSNQMPRSLASEPECKILIYQSTTTRRQVHHPCLPTPRAALSGAIEFRRAHDTPTMLFRRGRPAGEALDSKYTWCGGSTCV